MFKHCKQNNLFVQEQVEYRDIPGFPGYRVGSDGSVWSRWRRGCLTVMTDKWVKKATHHWKRAHYLTVVLHRDKKQKTLPVHGLVLMAFVGPKPPGMCACHNNGIATDNRPENLRWDTPKGNAADRKIHGTQFHADTHHNRKVSSAQVKEMRELYAKGGISYEKLGRMFGLCANTVMRAVRRITWKTVA
jgi:hypothetical protein